MIAGQRRWWVPRTSQRVATLLCAWLAVASWPSAAHYVSLDTLVRPGALTFGVALTGKPFAYRAGGELQGFEIDVARAVAAAHGLELVLVRLSRDSLATALVDGAVDTINTLATPATDHRVAVVPYLVTGDHAMVLRGNPYRIRGIEDLSGRIVAATAGSSGERFAREIDARLVDAGLEPMVIHSFLETRHTPFPVSMGHASAFFAGTVRDVNYLGGTASYHIDVLGLTVQAINAIEGPLFKEGDAVGLRIATADCVLLDAVGRRID